MTGAFDHMQGLLWFVVALLPLLVLQRRFHRELMSFFLLLTRQENVSLLLFSMVFLPGVFLHETSHWLVARLLRVRATKFSLLPEWQPGGTLRLGYVEVQQVDRVREALIGAAPLIFGGLFVAYAGLYQLNLSGIWEFIEGGGAGREAVTRLYEQPDFWLWLYLTFVVSSTMLPSASDRRAWVPIGLVVVAGAVLALVAGAGPWMLANLAPPLDNALRAVAVVFSISAVLHLLFLLPTVMLRTLLSRLTGLQVVAD
jgi:hypothetical protein